MNNIMQLLASNPTGKRALELMKSGNAKELETLARNMCKERGIDVNSALASIKRQFNLR